MSELLLRKGRERPFRKWNGCYQKEFYEVRLIGYKKVYMCWPNDGRMNQTDGDASRYWKKGDPIEVRLAEFNPLGIPTIYALITGEIRIRPDGPKDYIVSAVAEDGDLLCSHCSSSIDWAKGDIVNEAKHKHYRRKYPGGYQLIWLDEDELDDHPGFQRAKELNSKRK